MVQGLLKKKGSSGVKKPDGARAKKALQKSKAVTKGNPKQLPKKNFLNEALDDRDLTKAICRASEQKVAAKLIQGGGVLSSNELRKKGKELNKEIRRDQVKKKLTRVEEKLKDLKEKAEKQGIV